MVFGQKLIPANRISLERACQEEQNGANFSFVAETLGYEATSLHVPVGSLSVDRDLMEIP